MRSQRRDRADGADSRIMAKTIASSDETPPDDGWRDTSRNLPVSAGKVAESAVVGGILHPL